MPRFPVPVQRAFEQALIAGDYTEGDVLELEHLSQQFETSRDDMARVMAAEGRKGLVRRREIDRFEICGRARPDVGSVFVHAEERGLRPTSEVRAVIQGLASETVAGNIDLTRTLCDGTPEDVETEVREKAAKLAPGGGWLLGSSNSIPDFVPPENYRALLAASLRYGRYHR